VANDNQETAGKAQEPASQIIEIDLDAADPEKTITRRAADDIASAARGDNDDDRGAARDADANDPLMKSKEMRRRLARMNRSFDQRLAEREAAHQREIADLRKRLDGLTLEKTDASAGADAAHEANMTKLQADLEAANERGDSKEAAAISRKMARAEGQYWATKQAAAGSHAGTGGGAAAAAATAQAAAARTGPTAAGSRFILANEDWWEDPEFKLERQYANSLYADLVKEGYDGNDDETFNEIAARVKKKFPSLGIQSGRKGRTEDGDDDGDTRGNDTRGTDGNGHRRVARNGATNFQDRGSGGGNDVSRRGRVVITPADQSTMISAGMDPRNNAHVMQFVREKIALGA